MPRRGLGACDWPTCPLLRTTGSRWCTVHRLGQHRDEDERLQREAAVRVVTPMEGQPSLFEGLGESDEEIV